jgi:putative inorganic carbon (hco3(-)) transporter
MPDPRLQQSAYYLLVACAIANVFSIAAGQILLGAAIVAMVALRVPLRLPPLTLPLAIFAGGTLVSLALSPEPAAGLPQLKKFYVLLALFIAYNVIESISQAIPIVAGWAIAGAANGAYGIVEYLQKQSEADVKGVDFYLFYIANRITGFQSHWMTYSGVEMILLLTTTAWLLFAPMTRWTKYVWVAAVLIGTGIMLSDTRSVWIAAAAGAAYLFGMWKPRWIWVLPMIGGIAFVIAPDNVQQRVVSIWQPKRADSNEHRRIVNLTGFEMIKAHPFVGVGPQRVGRVFKEYLPPYISELPPGYYDHLHSIYVHYGAERGLPAMAGLVWMAVGALVLFIRAARRAMDRRAKALLHGAAAVVLAILIEGAFELNLGDSEVLLLFLVVLAIGYVSMGESPREPATT